MHVYSEILENTMYTIFSNENMNLLEATNGFIQIRHRSGEYLLSNWACSI